MASNIKDLFAKQAKLVAKRKREGNEDESMEVIDTEANIPLALEVMDT